jgi:hypothetical protein
MPKMIDIKSEVKISKKERKREIKQKLKMIEKELKFF